MIKLVSIFLSVLIAESAGIIGSIFTASSVRTWYVDLIKPLWNPPSWIFGPVWTVLYALMGISAYIVWQERSTSHVRTALFVYGVQLALNILWSAIFFGFKNPQIAFFEILVLLCFIIITTILFWRINVWAGVMLVPYILWVVFASYLNYTIWRLNG